MIVNVRNKKFIFSAIALLILTQMFPSTAAAHTTESVVMFCGSPITKYSYAKHLTPRQLYELLKLSGFKGQALKTAWAVAMKESHGNPLSHNFSYKTKDNSYGIFQINVYGPLEARIDQFNLDSVSDLRDPVVNAQIAFQMSGGGKNWSAWKGNPGQRDHWKVKEYLNQMSELV